MTRTINCKNITNIAQFHTEAKKVLNFSNYYGNNFDALLDELREIADNTQIGEPIFINFSNFSNLINALEPDILIKIMSVFAFWKLQYPSLQIKVTFEL